MQDIKSAMLSVNQSLTNAAAVQQGVPYNISGLSNNGNYTWQVIPSGTVTTVTVNLYGSIDGVNFFIIDQVTQADTVGFGYTNLKGTGWSSTLGEMRFVYQQQVNYLRIDLAVITGGGQVNAAFGTFESDR